MSAISFLWEILIFKRHMFQFIGQNSLHEIKKKLRCHSETENKTFLGMTDLIAEQPILYKKNKYVKCL